MAYEGVTTFHVELSCVLSEQAFNDGVRMPGLSRTIKHFLEKGVTNDHISQISTGPTIGRCQDARVGVTLPHSRLSPPFYSTNILPISRLHLTSSSSIKYGCCQRRPIVAWPAEPYASQRYLIDRIFKPPCHTTSSFLSSQTNRRCRPLQPPQLLLVLLLSFHFLSPLFSAANLRPTTSALPPTPLPPTRPPWLRRCSPPPRRPPPPTLQPVRLRHRPSRHLTTHPWHPFIRIRIPTARSHGPPPGLLHCHRHVRPSQVHERKHILQVPPGNKFLVPNWLPRARFSSHSRKGSFFSKGV